MRLLHKAIKNSSSLPHADEGRPRALFSSK
jgi:hypothetical protein